MATVQIEPSTAADTRLSTSDDGTKLKITAWSLRDTVTMVKIVGGQDPVTASFICTDTVSGTFCGILPPGVDDVDEFGFAVYNGSDFRDYGSDFLYRAKKQISTDPQGSIVMIATKDGNGCYKMNVVNNILKITNNTSSSIEGAIKAKSSAMCIYSIPYYSSNETLKYSPGTSNRGSFANAKFVIPVGTSYISMPSSQGDYNNHTFGICSSSDPVGNASLAPFKSLPSTGKIYTYVINF